MKYLFTLGLLIISLFTSAQQSDSLSITQWSDTLQNKSHNTQDSLNNIQNKLTNLAKTPGQKVDSLQQQLSSYKDSIETKVDEGRKQLTEASASPGEALDSLQNGVNKKISEVNHKLSDQLTTAPISNELDVPDELSGQMKDIQPDVQDVVPETNVDLDLEIENTEVPGLPSIQEATESIDIDTAPIAEELSLPKPELDKVVDTDELSKITSEVEEVGQEINDYTTLDSAAVQERLKEELSKRSEYQELLEGEDSVEEMKQLKAEQEGLAASYAEELQLESPEDIKERIARQSKKLANEHLNAEQAKVQAANEKLNKYKTWHEDAKSVKKLKTGILAPTDDTFFQRLSVYLDMEVVSLDDWAFDLAPGLDFSLTKRLSLGGAYVRRLLEDELANHYGFREHVGFRIKPQTEALVVYEQIRSDRTEADGESRRQWSPALQIGIKQRINLKGVFKLQFTALYNFSRINDEAYSQPINVRLGLVKRLKR